MRRTYEQLKKLRVKVIEDKKNGLTYEDIRRKRSVSPSTIAKWTKGKDLQRYCRECGETDPAKLEEHHQNKKEYPKWTVPLCANCHSEITRKQLKERRKKQEEVIVPQNVEVLPPKTNQSLSSLGTAVYAPRPIPATSTPPLTPEETRRLTRWGLFGAGGIAAGEAILEKRLPWWGRAALLVGAGIVFWIGGKIQTQTPNPQTE